MPCSGLCPARHCKPDHQHDQADLQQQAKDRRQAAETGEQAAAEQHAEQAAAKEARGEAAEQASAHARTAEQAAGRPARVLGLGGASFLAWFYLFAGVLVGYSRIYLGQHFLNDVLMGSCIGMIMAVLVHWLFVEKHWNSPKNT